MKKIILSAFAVMAFGFSNAQDIKFGVKAAVNMASLSGDFEDTSSLVGFQVGGFAEIKFSEKFAFQPELMYSAQGAKISKSDLFGDEDATYKLGYINIPLMAKYYLIPRLSLEFGPQVGFLLTSETDYDFIVPVDGETEFEDVKDSTSSLDFGLNFGAGFDFTESLTAGVRYNLGLSNVNDNEDDDYTIKNGVFSASIGYKF